MGVWGFLTGVGRQINPLDNNKTFKDKKGTGNASVATQTKNTAVGLAKGAVAAPWYFLKTDIINPAKEEIAKATGNKQAQANARASQKELLTPRKLIGNTAQLGLSFLAPGTGGITSRVATGVATGATSGVANAVAGDEVLNPANLVKSAAYGGAGGAAFGVVKPIKTSKETARNISENKPINSNQQGIERLAKATTEQEVRQIMKGTPQEVIDRVAPAIARTKDPHIVGSLIQKGYQSPVAQATGVNPAIPSKTTIPEDVRIKNDRITDLDTTLYRGNNKVNISQAHPDRPVFYAEDPTYAETYGKINSVPAKGRVLNINSHNAYDSPGFHLGNILADDPEFRAMGRSDRYELQNKYFNNTLSGERLSILLNEPMPEVVKRTYDRAGIDYIRIDSSQFPGTVGKIGHQTEIIQIPKPRESKIDQPAPESINGNPRIEQSLQQATIPQPISDVTSPTLSVGQPISDIVPAKSNNPVQGVVDALRDQGVESLQSRQAQLYSAARKTNLSKASQAGANLSGREATYAQLKALKGKLPTVDATALVDHLKTKVSPEQVNGILDSLRTSPHLSGYEPITAQNAIVKLFDEGKTPAPKEWEILQKSLGSDFTEALQGNVVDSLSSWQKVKNFAVEVLGAPKALMASFDLSGGGRQGAVLGSRFLPEWGRAQKESVKYLASKDTFENAMQEIASRENAPIYKKMGLNLASSGAHEEQFASTIAEKIPVVGRGVAASDRAYTGGLTQLRAGAADHIIKDLTDAGVDISTLSPKALKDIGRFINTASGRGSLGSLEKHAVSLGEALFSPRLWKSRLDMLNPVYYAKLDPIARKYALQSAGSFASIAGTVLGLAAAAGATVETDPRSSDYLKIKIGDTRYDILGGFQQNLVLAHRLITGEKKNSITGRVTDLTKGEFGQANRLSILSDFVQNKENPVIATGQTLLRGTDKAGNPVNPVTEVGKLAIPLGVQDTYKTIQSTGNVPESLLKSTLPSTVGVGVGTYGIKDLQPTDRQKAYIDQLKTSGAPKEQLEATKLFYSTLKAKPDRQKVSDDINQALAQGDTQKALQLSKDYNQKYAETFKDWLKQYKKYGNDKQLLKDYNAGKINLTTGSIKSRLKSIKTNPLFSATYPGG